MVPITWLCDNSYIGANDEKPLQFHSSVEDPDTFGKDIVCSKQETYLFKNYRMTGSVADHRHRCQLSIRDSPEMGASVPHPTRTYY